MRNGARQSNDGRSARGGTKRCKVVARAGHATVFPQGWSGRDLDTTYHQVADVISTEERAKTRFVRNNQRARYQGLTFWSPNINIFRDPRWGRGQETYGEDPYLTARLGVAFVKGLQGNDPRYLKVVATPKHYAVHSGPEPERHEFDAKSDERDLRETYLPAFKATCGGGAVHNARTTDQASLRGRIKNNGHLQKEWGSKASWSRIVVPSRHRRAS